MQVKFEIEGIEQLAANFNRLDFQAQKIASSALKAGLNVVAQQIKADLSPKIKHVRKTVGVVLKRSVRNGLKAAKVGFNVGKLRPEEAVRSGRNRGGVGISGENIHWWILGAGLSNPPRVRKKLAGKPPTGTMATQQVTLVPNAYAKTKQTALKAMQKAAARRLRDSVRELERKAARK